MKIRKTLNRSSIIIMTLAMLFAVVTISVNGLTAKASSNPVKLYYVDIIQNYHGYTSYNIYIQIEAKSAANKAIYVTVSDSNNTDTWIDLAATYYGKSNDSTEIWKATVSGFGLERFTIKYVGDGQTYWDNNNGYGYSFDDFQTY